MSTKSTSIRLVESDQFKRSCSVRINCDESEAGSGAGLQQTDGAGWRPIYFALRFLPPLNDEHPINERELIALVSTVEDLKYSSYGIKLQMVLDHEALATTLEGKCDKPTQVY